MNYLSHAAAFLDRPLVMVGSVTPDLLSAIDRRCRVRSKRVAALLESTETAPAVREVAEGLDAHLRDDHWFHGSQAFLEVSGRLTKLFRVALPQDDTHRVGFLGHIVVELLLDRWIIERKGEALDRFYDAFAAVDPQIVQYTVNAAASRSTTRLVPFWHRFVEERFLADYTAPTLMLLRLNQVMNRVGLPQLGSEIEEVIADGYKLVASRAVDLLPQRVVASLQLSRG